MQYTKKDAPFMNFKGNIDGAVNLTKHCSQDVREMARDCEWTSFRWKWIKHEKSGKSFHKWITKQ